MQQESDDQKNQSDQRVAGFPQFVAHVREVDVFVVAVFRYPRNPDFQGFLPGDDQAERQDDGAGKGDQQSNDIEPCDRIHVREPQIRECKFFVPAIC